MHSADCYLNITYLFYLGSAWFSLRSGPLLKACACPPTISAPWLLCRSWGKNVEKVMLFSASWRRRVWKWGFKWSANRRERATVNDLIALGSCYGRDPVSPPSQEQKASLGSCSNDVFVDGLTMHSGLTQSLDISAFDFRGFRHEGGGIGEDGKSGFQPMSLLCSLQDWEHKRAR